MDRADGGTRYRGGPGMWAWVAHRITGVAVFLLLLIQVVSTALIRLSPAGFENWVSWYRSPVGKILQTLLVAALLFHALNGLRVMAIDFWPRGPRYQRPLLWVVLAIWVLAMVPSSYLILRNLGSVS